MNIINYSNNEILKQLGINKHDSSKKIRLNKFLLFEDSIRENVEGKIIYNEFTRAFIWIPNYQFENIYNTNIDYVQWMWDNYFLVDEDYDELTVTNNLKSYFRANPESDTYLTNGNIKDYTIFTTTACNARCFYCYEKGRQQVPMTAKTASAVGDYIVKSACKNGTTIQLRWFGGEPLVNENAIDIICQKVKDAGYKYESSITTNGFLFKKEKLDKYKNLWHLVSGQVTIDGTEEVYNKTKNYKNVKGKNPYRIVLDNTKMMADWGMHISIRMNMDIYNAENIKQLIVELEKEFNHHPKISMYCYPIFDVDDRPRTDEENKQLYKKLEEIDQVLKNHNYYNPKYRSSFIRHTHCMIDGGYSVLIGTNGDLGLCEHYSESEFWGHINKPEQKDMEVIKSFQEYVEADELCKSCPIFPSCIRPKKCLDLKHCNQYIKDWHIREAHEGVHAMYINWINSIQNHNQNIKLNNIQNNNQNIKCNKNELCNNLIKDDDNNDNISFFKKIKIFLGF